MVDDQNVSGRLAGVRLFGVDGAPLCYKVSTIGTPTPLGRPGYHRSKCRSRPLSVVADYLIAKVNLFHPLDYWQNSPSGKGHATTVE